MDFSKRAPSTKWTTLTYEGAVVAQVWFKPEGNPVGLQFLMPTRAFQLPDLENHLTMANLLKTVQIELKEIQSWTCSGIVHEGMNGTNPDFNKRIGPSSNSSDPVPIDVLLNSGHASEITPEQWNDLASRWDKIALLESEISRIRTEAERLCAKLDSLWNTTLTLEDKYASRLDIAKWEEAKKRIPHLRPELIGFLKSWNSIAAASIETKSRFVELIKTRNSSFSQMEMSNALNELESIRKNRQVWISRGNDLCNLAQGVMSRAQVVLGQLKSSAKANFARKKK